MNEDLLQRIEKLEREVANLRDVTKTPLEIENALKSRLQVPSINVSNVAQADVERTIDTSGMSAVVLDYPSGWLKVITSDNKIKYIPTYDD